MKCLLPARNAGGYVYIFWGYKYGIYFYDFYWIVELLKQCDIYCFIILLSRYSYECIHEIIFVRLVSKMLCYCKWTQLISSDALVILILQLQQKTYVLVLCIQYVALKWLGNCKVNANKTSPIICIASLFCVFSTSIYILITNLKS